MFSDNNVSRGESVILKSKGDISIATAGKGQSQPSKMYELSEDY